MQVIILGAGELASSVAHRLFRSGFTVLMTEIDQPLAVRRTVSFCSAIWEGETSVEGVSARRLTMEQLAQPRPQRQIAVIVDPKAAVLTHWLAQVLIDARILKVPGGTSINQAPLVISLGPGAVCGTDAHCVIETNRGHNLGRILETGSAAPDTGIPAAIAGITGSRVLRAPCSGPVKGLRGIGDLVQPGETIATVAGMPAKTEISGVVRGVLRDGVQAVEGVKLADIDPRGNPEACFTISDKGRTISGAVLEAILRRFELVS